MSKVPEGTPLRVNLPSSFVVAETVVLTTITRASARGRLPSAVIRPVMVPCADATLVLPSAKTASDNSVQRVRLMTSPPKGCLLYTSDAADERSSVDLGGRRII